MPLSIVIISPLPGNVIAGNVQILGSAIHPQFLQYRLEFGPDPNPNNLWFPITGIVQTPILNSVLGIWNTNTGGSSDGFYQVRLRVFLRDGSQQTTVVNNIKIQNRNPTPIPSNTPSLDRPIAAFTQDFTSGTAPLVVRFFNQSQGNISSYFWNFGNGNTSAELNPIQTFTQPGIYNVSLLVRGPGGEANVTRQISVTSLNAPTAAFVPDKISGVAPLTVNFVNQSTGTITGYKWDFGNGQESTAVNPSNTFTAVGTYNVILTATGPGGSNSVVRQITVTNPQIPEPVAEFEPSTTTGLTPLTVTFVNKSTGQITQYLWDFNGDGITDSVDKDPTQVYATSGTFTAKLTVIGPGGQKSKSVDIIVQAPPNAPVANFTGTPLTGTAPLQVVFNNTTTGTATAYAWDFDNDGQPDSTETSPTHTYPNPGTYVVKLTATNAGGSTTKQETISVLQPVVPPDALFSVDVDNGTAPLTVTFTSTSTGTIESFEWDFGDGSPKNTTDNPAIHTYAAEGTYNAILKVANSGGQDTISLTINVGAALPAAPVAGFVADPTSGNAPLTVTFTNISTGTVDSFGWDFDGDGGADNTTDNTATFVYTTEGTYNTTLTVTNAGGSDTISVPITVGAALPNPPVAQFTANPTSGNAPLDVTFANTSTGTVDSLSWDFNGDGTADNTTDNSATFTFAAEGTYNASLTVTNAGGSDTIAVAITVSAAIPNAPVADFTVDVSNGTAPLTVTFTNNSQGTIDSFAWDFNGDGTPDDTTSNPATFTYNTEGTYNATLTVTNTGGSDSLSIAITVGAAIPNVPVANFTTDVISGQAPLTVTFTNMSTGTVDSFEWDFGDGSPKNTTDNPATHTYMAEGAYNATLTVTNAGGTNTFSVPIIVNAAAQPPVASFTASTNSGDAPLDVTFDNTSTGTVDSFSWDFNGDGFPEDTTNDPVTFTFANAGTFTVILSVTGAGQTVTSTQTITVNSAAPTPPPNPPADIIYAADNELYLVKADGTGTINLTNNPANDSQHIISPNGEKIAFVSDRDGNENLWILNINDLSVTQVTFDPGSDTQPVWSSDASRLMFVRGGNIFTINADGTGETQITFDNTNSQPVWSPDNSKIAYVSNNTGNNEIYVMNADGTNVINVTNDGNNDVDPQWSPDGSLIVFTSNRFGDDDIFTINSGDGSNLQQLTDDSANDRQPTWSQDGTKIVFVSNRGGADGLYLMNADGSNELQLIATPINGTLPRWRYIP
jgi:PKD repeat protein